nr:2-oxo acid dehydrogenase subunit E2 [Actinomycetota bacterium]
QPDGARQGGPAATDPEQTGAPRPLAKPPVRKYAKDLGVDLSAVTPTREDGVITRADVDAHRSGAADAPGAAAQTAPDTLGAAAQTVPEASGGESGGSGPRPTAYSPPGLDRTGERETRIPVKGVRRMTAQAMVGSAFTAPHVTEFITVDVTATMELVERLRTDREFRDIKVSPLLILAKALVLAVRRHPGMVAVWDEDAQEIVQRNYLNLGIAAATPRGLIVPNIKDADLMDLRQLAEAMADLVATARAGRTQPAQMSGGTITITNVGVFGVDTGTPIINPGESAIVCFGAVRKQPWVVTDAAGADQIVPRWITQLAVSFDHRLIDGAMGSQFLADLAAVLEDPTRALVWG